MQADLQYTQFVLTKPDRKYEASHLTPHKGSAHTVKCTENFLLASWMKCLVRSGGGGSEGCGVWCVVCGVWCVTAACK